MILNEFHQWLTTQQSQAVPQSPLGEAVSYTLNQWESLCLFTSDGDIPIDNNRTEHALRQQVLGRAPLGLGASADGGRKKSVGWGT